MLTLIDGSGYIFRAYHALPKLTSPAGVPVGAVVGFINMIVKLMDSHGSDHVAVVFDAGRHTFRNRLYPEYKAHRPPPPDDLIPQFQLVREAADALGIARVEAADFEADDLIAAYAKAARGSGMEVNILSSDKDLMQLISSGVSMQDAVKMKPIGEAEVREKFGVGPALVRDVLALIGDSSDNVPGVPGIGPKTAAELVNQFGSLEAVLAHAHEITKPKCREAVIAHADAAKLSYQLIGLDENAPLPLPLEAFALKKPEAEALNAFLHTHGFHSLQARLKDKFNLGAAPSPTTTHQPTTTNYHLVQDMATLTAWLAEAREAGLVAFDTETDSLDATRANLIGFSLATAPGRACYVPLAHVSGGEGALFAAPVSGQIPFNEAIAALKLLLEDASVLKIGQNIKYDMVVMAQHGVDISPLADTMLLSYAFEMGQGGHGMDELAQRHLAHKTITYDEVTGTGRARVSFAEVALDKARDYAAEDADIALRLYHHLLPLAAGAGKLTVYETLERPLISVLSAMERRGILVDPARLEQLSQEFAMRMNTLEKEIHALAGVEFNIGSPKQLGEVLFERLNLPGGKKGKTGAYGTDSSVLEELAAQGHTLPGKVLEWRQLAKLRSTYAEALKNQIHPKTHRVHTCFSMASTNTGRLSSSDPNLQNIPIRTIEGRKIRSAFVAPPGQVLISADYSQIELRLLAHMADIAPLKEAFRTGADIHAITASQMFGVPVEGMDPGLRRSAKMINFGIIYGMSAHGLAVRLNIPRAEAAAYIERYFAQYPGIRAYMERTKEFARAHGYVETLYGRRTWLPAINASNGALRQFAERQAINAPLQGTAADIIKRAMIQWEQQENPPARLLLQVHDELVFETPETQAEAAMAAIKRIMEGAAHLSVPLTVEVGSGSHWDEVG